MDGEVSGVASFHKLDALFRPASVAIIGASNDPNKVGGRPLQFLRQAGYAGRIVPINPNSAQIQGLTAWRSLAEACADGGPVEQAILAVPAADVLKTARECIGQGVKALQIFSAGFGDGAAGRAASELLAVDAKDAGVRVLGPNSLGLFDLSSRFFGTFATALDGAWPQPGPISIATQSGAFGSYFFGMAQARGLGLRRFVATGNESDVQVADCVSYFAEDEGTRVIVIALEGCRDGRRLAEALQRARAAGKLVLAMKVGVSQAGAAAAATHTGALAGADRVFDAVLREAGACRADSLQALVDAAYCASRQPLPAGRELLVVTTSGGIGVLTADASEARGMRLPPIGGEALAEIRGIAPLAEGRNPVDTSAGILGALGAYARIGECALGSRRFDMVVCFLAHIARNPVHWAQLREPLYEWRRRHPGVPFAAVLLCDADIAADLEQHGFAVFDDPTRAVAGMAACVQPHEHSEAHVEALHAASVDEPADWPSSSSPAAAQQMLARLGISFAPEYVVHTAEEAAQAAGEVGYPVVLKILSPDIAHKTEVGGVELGIADEVQLRTAVPAMLARVNAARPQARIEGLLVARQLRGGVEILVGTQRDPVFGPVVTVGAGGVLAELIDDVHVGLAPVSPEAARRMLLATRIGRLCQGFRGAPAVDIDAAAHQIARLSQIAWACRDRIEGIDINPLLVTTDGAHALDALVVARVQALPQESSA